MGAHGNDVVQKLKNHQHEELTRRDTDRTNMIPLLNMHDISLTTMAGYEGSYEVLENIQYFIRAFGGRLML